LEVLENLLGSEGKDPKEKDEVNGSAAEDDFEYELDFEGLSLREVVARKDINVEEEHVYTTQSIEECMLSVSESFPTNTNSRAS
jgi:hypothetical protein